MPRCSRLRFILDHGLHDDPATSMTAVRMLHSVKCFLHAHVFATRASSIPAAFMLSPFSMRSKTLAKRHPSERLPRRASKAMLRSHDDTTSALSVHRNAAGDAAFNIASATSTVPMPLK